MVVAKILLTLAGCFLLSQPEATRPCESPHLWYAPDASGDVYFGCTPPEGWGRTPPDEHLFETPPTPTPPPEVDTGTTATDGWVPPPPPDTGGPLPDTAELDTGLFEDTGLGDTGLGDTGLGGTAPDDTGLPPEDTADTGLPWEDTGAFQRPPEDTGLPPGDTGSGPEELPLQDDEIAIETPEGVRVLSPADTGYYIELDALNAPR